MIVFIPFYHPDSKEFTESLSKQTVPFITVRRDRKKDNIYWTKACNDFYRDVKKFRGIKDDEVICIMNNDISFDEGLFEDGSKVKRGEVYIPKGTGLKVDWSKKSFTEGGTDCFVGRTFFMTYGDFVKSKGFFSLLPHCLADIEFSLRQGLRVVEMESKIHHKEHSHRSFSITSPDNPFFWIVFLLKAGRNRYLPLNIIKVLVDGYRRLKELFRKRKELVGVGDISSNAADVREGDGSTFNSSTDNFSQCGIRTRPDRDWVYRCKVKDTV